MPSLLCLPTPFDLKEQSDTADFWRVFRIEDSQDAPVIAIIVNRRLPGYWHQRWQRSDAQHFIFPFKPDCWEFSLSNTLDDKCLEEKWIRRRIKHGPQTPPMSARGIWCFNVKTERLLVGTQANTETEIESCRKKEEKSSIYLDSCLSFDLSLVTWPFPHLHTQYPH